MRKLWSTLAFSFLFPVNADHLCSFFCLLMLGGFFHSVGFSKLPSDSWSLCILACDYCICHHSLRGREQGGAAACSVASEPSPPCDVTRYLGHWPFSWWPRSLLCQARERADISAACCLAHFGGGGEVLLSLLARPVAPTVLLRVIPGPLPALPTSPGSEPLLNLFLFCEENLLCVVNCGFPISIQSRLSQGFLIMGVHLEGPFWFPSITVDLFWSAMLCVTSRNLERERGQVCVMRSLCWSNLWGVSWKQVQSPPTPSSKIQRGLPRELGWQNQLN